MSDKGMIGWTRDGDGVAEKLADFAYDVKINDVSITRSRSSPCIARSTASTCTS
jgi:hypothetical protein